MSEQANVRSIETISDFRAALAEFADQARGALTAAEMDIRRTTDWLEREQPLHWQHRLKQSQEELATARTELARKRLRGINADMPDLSEEQEKLRAAQRRVAQAEQKLDSLRTWSRAVQQAVLVFRGQRQQLDDHVDTRLPACLALLDRMTAALEAYRAMQAPSTSEDRRASVARPSDAESDEPATDGVERDEPSSTASPVEGGTPCP